MGNLFSKNDPPPVRPNPVPIRPYSPNFYEVIGRPDPITVRPTVYVRPDPPIARPSVYVRPDPPIPKPRGKLVTPDPALIINCLEALPPDQLRQEMILAYRWNPRSINPRTVQLDEDSVEYLEIKQLFRKTNKKCFHVERIEKIYNPYILLQYHTKKQSLEQKFGPFGFVKEELVFHGTNQTNVTSIVNNNFNWRLRGTYKGHLFGHGVSFSPISNYATHYGDKKGVRAMFLVKMLMVNCAPGDKDTIIPPVGYDTTYKPPNRHVYVKYDDNTFCPTHVIYYYENQYNHIMHY